MRIDDEKLRSKIGKLRVCDPLARKWFPAYICLRPEVKGGVLLRFWFFLLQIPVHAFIWIVLHPRRERPGALDQREVDSVYTRQAARYDRTHHFTTRGQDMMWRRMAGWVASTLTQPNIKILDLCTGTGLTVMEIARVLKEQEVSASIVGLDYNEAMLATACKRSYIKPGERSGHGEQSVHFVRGDATAFVAEETTKNSGFATLGPQSIDLVTQVFGIGGIDDPLAVFAQVLSVLREGGKYLLIDMHQPIPGLAGEWAFLGKWVRTPNFEAYTYLRTTIPLALARLWAWRDTTFDFYLAPITCKAENGTYWGFKVVMRAVESERWWLALPVMPTCRLLLEKVQIDEKEFKRRQKILIELSL